MDNALCTALLAKIDEQISKTDHLAGLVPLDTLDWQPPIAGAFSLGKVLGHLLECLAGFCAVLLAAEPERCAHFERLKGLPVNHRCPPAEAKERAGQYRTAIHEGFTFIDDSSLARKIPTVFVKDGEPLMTLLLGNLEHLVNHKHQLFMYLQLVGVPVKSVDLYRFRG